METKTCQDCHCRLIRIAKFWKENCPEHHAIDVVKVLNADLKNPSKFSHSHCKEDRVYIGLKVVPHEVGSVRPNVNFFRFPWVRTSRRRNIT